jgi:hypothetical protein
VRVASVWEIRLKWQLNRLDGPLAQMLRGQQAANDLRMLPKDIVPALLRITGKVLPPT